MHPLRSTQHVFSLALVLRLLLTLTIVLSSFGLSPVDVSAASSAASTLPTEIAANAPLAADANAAAASVLPATPLSAEVIAAAPAESSRSWALQPPASAQDVPTWTPPTPPTTLGLADAASLEAGATGVTLAGGLIRLDLAQPSAMARAARRATPSAPRTSGSRCAATTPSPSPCRLVL